MHSWACTEQCNLLSFWPSHNPLPTNPSPLRLIPKSQRKNRFHLILLGMGKGNLKCSSLSKRHIHSQNCIGLRVSQAKFSPGLFFMLIEHLLLISEGSELTHFAFLYSYVITCCYGNLGQIHIQVKWAWVSPTSVRKQNSSPRRAD